jgi:hypothetical protein
MLLLEFLLDFCPCGVLGTTKHLRDGSGRESLSVTFSGVHELKTGIG